MDSIYKSLFDDDVGDVNLEEGNNDLDEDTIINVISDVSNMMVEWMWKTIAPIVVERE